MILAAVLSVLLAFSQVATPQNTDSPQSPSFGLMGFKVSKGGDAVDSDAPQYLPETDATRAMALIRFTPAWDATCMAFEFEDGAKAHRVAMPIVGGQDGLAEVKKGAEVKLAAVFVDASDIRAQKLAIDPAHRSFAVGCMRDKGDGTVFYSQTYGIDVVPYAPHKSVEA